MRKSVAAGVGVGAVVVVGAAYLGATAWAGGKTQVRYQEQMAKAQGQLPFLTMGQQQYQKGFFSSTSTTSFQLGCPTADGKPAPAIVVVDTIKHGPFAGGTLAAAVIDSQVSLGGEPGRQLAAMFAGPSLTAHTVVGFSGGTSSTVHSPAARIAVPDGSEIAWQGLDGTVDAGSDARTVAYRLKSPGLTISNPAQGASVRLSALEMQAEGRAVAGSGLLKVGKGQGSVGAVEVVVTPPAGGASGAGKPTSVSFADLKFSNETSVTDELLSGTGTMSGIGTIAGAKVDRIEMRVSMKRVHAPTYQRLMETVTRAGPGCSGVGKPAADPATVLATMQADLAALLQYNPEFSLDQLAMDYAGQRGELAYGLAVQGVTAADAQQPLPALLLAHGRATASARLPVAWIRQLAQAGGSRLQGAAPDPAMVDVMIDQMAAQGFLVRDGEFVRSNAEFAGGELKVNGKPLALGGPPGAGGAARRPGT